MNPELTLEGSARILFCVILMAGLDGENELVFPLYELGIIVDLLFCFNYCSPQTIYSQSNMFLYSEPLLNSFLLMCIIELITIVSWKNSFISCSML